MEREGRGDGDRRGGGEKERVGKRAHVIALRVLVKIGHTNLVSPHIFALREWPASPKPFASPKIWNGPPFGLFLVTMGPSGRFGGFEISTRELNFEPPVCLPF